MNYKPGDKIRILKAKEKLFWYHNHIGQVFTLKKKESIDLGRFAVWSIEERDGKVLEMDIGSVSKLDKVLS